MYDDGHSIEEYYFRMTLPGANFDNLMHVDVVTS